jgi:hypothetical protein
MQTARRLAGGSAWLALVVIVAVAVVVASAFLWRDAQGPGSVWQIGGDGVCETGDVDLLGPAQSGGDTDALVFRARAAAPVERVGIAALLGRYELVVVLVVTPLFVLLLARLVRRCMGDPSGWGHVSWR